MSKYEDIINLPHHVSEKRAPMSMIDRGAQFSPFAALTGYDAAIQETARLTDRRIELSDGQKEQLNEKLQLILENLRGQPEVTVTYFCPDGRKGGGAYVTAAGIVSKIDGYRKLLIMKDGTVISFEDIYEIQFGNHLEEHPIY